MIRLRITMTLIINDEAIETLNNRLADYVWTEQIAEERESLRQQFKTTYDIERIANLTREDYFAGLGRKQGCMAYDLEWGTKILGSIKGGSNFKYGYETDFPKIKSIIKDITSIDSKTAYATDGVFFC